MKHYVYRITNLLNNKHYYGTRSAINPIKDLGIKYFSSSTDEAFIKDQKFNPSNYRYKIIGIYSTRVEAIIKEILLHNKFDVGVNANFYNKVKQTSTGFDTTGISPVISDYQKAVISKTHKGKVLSASTRKKISDNHIDVSGVNNPMYGSKGAMLGMVLVINITTDIKGLMFKEDFVTRSNNIVAYSSVVKRTCQLRKCPHCFKEGKGGNMTRYHFDNCKLKEVENASIKHQNTLQNIRRFYRARRLRSV